MAIRGRKPQTKKQKTAKGEKRPCRLVDNVVKLPAIETFPIPPNWLNEHGTELWKEITPMLFNQKVLSNADLFALAHMCQLHGEIVDGYTRKVYPKPTALSELRKFYSEFGMTPSSRTRVGNTEPNGNKNKFNNNGTRKKFT